MITVIDYHKGNLKSVERGLAAQGAEVLVTDDTAAIAQASALVLPGVGAFTDAAATMGRLGQMEAVREALGQGAAFLGICLGMHLMFEAGEEDAALGAPHPRGLGLVPGTVRRLPKHDAEGVPYKIPHVGWNSVVLEAEEGAPDSAGAPSSEAGNVAHKASSAAASEPEGHRGPSRRGPSERLGDAPSLQPTTSLPSLFAGIEPGEYFYFTHSYAAPDTPATIGLTTHSVTFPSAVAVGDRVFGVQFHPEKSSDAGARLLHNFVTLAERLGRTGA